MDWLASLNLEQRLCLALALWYGKDPILKERLFDLSNAQGNHGEDVKERYYFLDATPSHSYLKMLYKYPLGEYPYTLLVQENTKPTLQDNEYELIDTGISRVTATGMSSWSYFKAVPDDILVEISIYNRGPESATIHVLPQLWFRNTWSWAETIERPSLLATADGSILAEHASLGAYQLYADPKHELLFCENETNEQRSMSSTRGIIVDRGVQHLPQLCTVGGSDNLITKPQHSRLRCSTEQGYGSAPAAQ
jgi:hypothetical protein